jgi:hypothetical protein
VTQSYDLAKTPLFYGEQKRVAHVTLGPTGSAGAYRMDDLSSSHGPVTSVRRLADKTIEFNLSNDGAFILQTNPRVVHSISSAAHGLQAVVLEENVTGSVRIGVISGSAYTDTWTKLHVDFTFQDHE